MSQETLCTSRDPETTSSLKKHIYLNINNFIKDQIRVLNRFSAFWVQSSVEF